MLCKKDKGDAVGSSGVDRSLHYFHNFRIFTRIYFINIYVTVGGVILGFLKLVLFIFFVEQNYHNNSWAIKRYTFCLYVHRSSVNTAHRLALSGSYSHCLTMQPNSSNGTDPKDPKENFDDVQSSSERFVLEFRVSQIAGQFDVDTIANAIEHDLNTAPKDAINFGFDQITGVVKYPERWTQKILIYLDSEHSKNDLLVRGLTLYNQHIELSELGLGPIKVMVQNADLYFSDNIIKQWLCQYGVITGFKHETHKLRHAKSSKWYTGNRIVWMKNVNKSIPPVAKLTSGDDVANISIWHYGQTEIKCRFCHLIVPKGHVCRRAPPKKCFSCGENDHTKADCPQTSYGIQFPSLSGSSASAAHPNAGKTPLNVINPSTPIRRSPTVSPNDKPKAKKQRTHSSHSLSFYDPDNTTGSTQRNSQDPDENADTNMETDSSPRGRTSVKGTCEVAFFSDNNSKEMELIGDDILKLNTTMPTEDALKIETAGGMLSRMTPQRKKDVDVAVVHIGAQHFPTKDKEEFDNIYMSYQHFVQEVMDECPKSSIVISSVLPRAGSDSYKEAINSCIDHFNGKLHTFSKMDDTNKSRIHYLNNDIHFKDEGKKVIGGLYIDPDGEGVQTTDEGCGRLKSGIIDAIKSVFYQDKLIDAQNFSMGDAHTSPNI